MAGKGSDAVAGQGSDACARAPLTLVAAGGDDGGISLWTVDCGAQRLVHHTTVHLGALGALGGPANDADAGASAGTSVSASASAGASDSAGASTGAEATSGSARSPGPAGAERVLSITFFPNPAYLAVGTSRRLLLLRIGPTAPTAPTAATTAAPTAPDMWDEAATTPGAAWQGPLRAVSWAQLDAVPEGCEGVFALSVEAPGGGGGQGAALWKLVVEESAAGGGGGGDCSPSPAASLDKDEDCDTAKGSETTLASHFRRRLGAPPPPTPAAPPPLPPPPRRQSWFAAFSGKTRAPTPPPPAPTTAVPTPAGTDTDTDRDASSGYVFRGWDAALGGRADPLSVDDVGHLEVDDDVDECRVQRFHWDAPALAAAVANMRPT